MSVTDMSFLCNYKGTLYPLHLDPSAPVDRTRPSVSVKPLVDLCSEKIVQDGTTTARAMNIIPTEICYSLMKAALLNTRDRAIEVLISRWPWNVLHLGRLAASLFTDLRALYSDAYVAERMRRGIKYTTCLAHTFVECLKKRSPTKLKYLDISGYPTAELIVAYLSSHALLVYNEARQKEIISMYNEVAENLPEEAKQKYQLETTLPDDCYLIHLDAFVETDETHMELCKALRLTNQNRSRLKLRINKLDVGNLGVARIAVLLDQVDTEHLTGLCLQYNRMGPEGLTVLAPTLQKLKALTSLDLSCNIITLTNDQERAELLGETLASLPHLCRLNLSNNRLRNKAAVVLSKIQRPLTHMELSACGLNEPDLQFLSRSHHIGHVQELDISENNLGRHFESLCALLSAGQFIRVLETEDCYLDQTHFTHLLHITAKNLKHLWFWNLSRNVAPRSADLLLEDMKAVVQLASLRTVVVSYPEDIASSVEEPEEQRRHYETLLHLSLNQLCEHAKRASLKVVLVNT